MSSVRSITFVLLKTSYLMAATMVVMSMSDLQFLSIACELLSYVSDATMNDLFQIPTAYTVSLPRTFSI